MIETADELASFTNADEFGSPVSVDGVNFSAIIDRYHNQQRPASTTNSSVGAFTVGAADLNLTTLEAIVTVPLPAGVDVEKTLIVAEGKYAGSYRIKDLQVDGDVTTLILNKRP